MSFINKGKSGDLMSGGAWKTALSHGWIRWYELVRQYNPGKTLTLDAHSLHTTYPNISKFLKSYMGGSDMFELHLLDKGRQLDADDPSLFLEKIHTATQ